MTDLQNLFTCAIILFTKAVGKCPSPKWIYGGGHFKTNAYKNGIFFRGCRLKASASVDTFL
jgi:hypothetical protein